MAEESQGNNSLLRDKVTEEEIARIVARWTGIPVAKLMEGEREKLLHLEDILHRAGHRPGRGGGEGNGSDPALPRGDSGSEPPDRFLPVPWAPPASAKRSLPRRWPQALFDDETQHGAHRYDANTWRNIPYPA